MNNRAPLNSVTELIDYISTRILQFNGVVIENVDTKGFLGSSLLQIVVEQETSEKVCLLEAKLLVDAGANVNCTGEMGVTPLHSVAYRNRLILAQFLLQAGAVSGVKDDYGFTAAKIAEIEGFEEMARLLKHAELRN